MSAPRTVPEGQITANLHTTFVSAIRTRGCNQTPAEGDALEQRCQMWHTPSGARAVPAGVGPANDALDEYHGLLPAPPSSKGSAPGFSGSLSSGSRLLAPSVLSSPAPVHAPGTRVLLVTCVRAVGAPPQGPFHQGISLTKLL